MRNVKFRSGKGNTINFPGSVELHPDMSRGSHGFELGSCEIAGRLTSSRDVGSLFVHMRLHLADAPGRFVMLDLAAEEARDLADELRAAADEKPYKA